MTSSEITATGTGGGVHSCRRARESEADCPEEAAAQSSWRYSDTETTPPPTRTWAMPFGERTTLTLRGRSEATRSCGREAEGEKCSEGVHMQGQCHDLV